MTVAELVALPWVKDWIAPLVLAFGGGLITRWLTPKARVIWANLHQFAFLADRTPQQSDPDQSRKLLIYTRTVLVQNIGRVPAENVEIYLPAKPDNYQIFPTVGYTERQNPDGFHVITIDRLVAGELVMLEMLQARAELPEVLRVRTSERFGEQRQMQWQRVYTKPVLAFVALLMALGLFLLARLAIEIAVYAFSLSSP